MYWIAAVDLPLPILASTILIFLSKVIISSFTLYRFCKTKLAHAGSLDTTSLPSAIVNAFVVYDELNVFVIVHSYIFSPLYYSFLQTRFETVAAQGFQRQFAHRGTSCAQAKIFCLKKFRKLKICFS